MASFEIRSEGEAHLVEGANWMAALGDGLARFGLGSEELGRVICDLDPSGLVRVRHTGSGRSFEIVEQADPSAEAVQVQVGPGEAAPEPSVRPRLASSLVEDDLVQDPGILEAPDPHQSPAFETVSERSGDAIEALVEASAELLDTETVQDASELALTLAHRFVPAESGAVLLVTPDQQKLVFIAATGPRAADVIGLQIPRDKGIAGLAVSSRTAMLVREVRADPRHHADVDQRSGYTTRALLVVPLRGPRGVHGCLELLNPFGVSEFEEWHLEACQMLAARLASRLG